MKIAKAVCEVEEILSLFTMPNNNTFPLWCYGAPTIVRYQDKVYATIPEVSPDTPPMCNTRPQLFLKTGDEGWQRVFVNPIFDQREPCPVASLGDGRILISINSAITPFRGENQGKYLMWYCEPYLLSLDGNQPDHRFPEVINPPGIVTGPLPIILTADWQPTLLARSFL